VKAPKHKKPRIPVREYLGKYEQFVLVMKGRAAFLNADTVLERLLAIFPKHKGWEDFTSTDIADYREARLKQGLAETSLVFELATIYRFFKWLIEDKGLYCNNPVRAFRNSNWTHQKLTRLTIGLRELNALLRELPSDKERRLVLDVVRGAKMPRGQARKIIQQAAERAGIRGFSLYQVASFVRARLARDIINDYCLKLLNTLAPEPKPNSNTLADIQVPALDEGTPISNSDDNLVSISRVS
jgi:hypothetical protein